jgi:hypothetical protein
MLDIKVINPLENLDNTKMEKLEKLVGEFYTLSENVDLSKQKNLAKFQDVDLDQINLSDVDLMKFLEIEEP